MVESLPLCLIDSRMSSMAKRTPERANLLQGTLDMLIFELFFMVLLTVTRSASIFSEPRTIFSRCSTAHFTPLCTGWSEGDGSPRNGRWLQIGIGNSSTTGLQIREENSLSSKSLSGSRWQKLWRG